VRVELLRLLGDADLSDAVLSSLLLLLLVEMLARRASEVRAWTNPHVTPPIPRAL
jgi:hypothetical protein